LLPPWQRRGHLRVDQTRLCQRKQLTIVTTKMINTTRKGSPQMPPLLIVLAAALRAPADDLTRRRPDNPELPGAGKNSPNRNTVNDYGYPPLRRRPRLS
jgi:hypothetical protein